MHETVEKARKIGYTILSSGYHLSFCYLSLQYFKRDSYIVTLMSGLSKFQWKAESVCCGRPPSYARSQLSETGIRYFFVLETVP